MAESSKPLPEKLVIPEILKQPASKTTEEDESNEESEDEDYEVNGFIYGYVLMIFTTFVTPILFAISIGCFLAHYVSNYIIGYKLSDEIITVGCVLFYIATCNYCYFNQATIKKENQGAI